jgi:hypothetical protein
MTAVPTRLQENSFSMGRVFPITKKVEFEVYYQDLQVGSGAALSVYF